MIYVLNTLIVPVDFDKEDSVTVRFRKTTLEEVRKLLNENQWTSAIGHKGTSEILTQILGIEIPENRVTLFFQKGDRGVHFFLKRRLPEGVVLSAQELEKLEYWLVLSEVL